jgi:hypothetical protein
VYIHVNTEDLGRKKYLLEYLRGEGLERWYTEILEGWNVGVME